MAPSKGAQLVGFSLVDMMGKCVQVEYFWQILLFLLILILYEFIWDIWGHMVPKADKGIFHLIFTISCKIKIVDFFSRVDMMGKCVQVEYFWQLLLFLLILILYEFIWDIWGHMVPRDFSPNFYDFLQNKNHGFFFSCGYDGQVCVGRIILVDFTLPLDSDFI